MRLGIAAALAALVVVAPLQAAEEGLTVTVRRLTMETALRIAQGAVTACRAKGVQVGVTVVDRGGHPQVVLRDVLAPDLTLQISRMKAYTALSFAVPSGTLAGRFEDPNSVGKADGIILAAGGLPVTAGGALLGAVGVSGAPSGSVDEECAKAGVEAVAVELEMADG